MMEDKREPKGREVMIPGMASVKRVSTGDLLVSEFPCAAMMRIRVASLMPKCEAADAGF